MHKKAAQKATDGPEDGRKVTQKKTQTKKRSVAQPNEAAVAKWPQGRPPKASTEAHKDSAEKSVHNEQVFGNFPGCMVCMLIAVFSKEPRAISDTFRSPECYQL